MLPLIFASVLFVPQTPLSPFTRAEPIAEGNRLALTPTMDGKIRPEEWDVLTRTDTVTTYLVWEPDMLHLAARLPLGDDCVFSIDGQNDGWLVGDDNLEVRVTLIGANPVLQVRGLDGGGPDGPHWIDVPAWERGATVTGATEVGFWSFELTIEDPGVDLLPSKPATIAIRADSVPVGQPTPDATVPRVMTPINLTFDRSAGLPEDLIWKPNAPVRSVVPGNAISIRHTFKGNNDLNMRRIEMETTGDAKDYTTSEAVPFPDFDKKGRAFVDYKTKVLKGLREGWYVQKSVVTTKDGIQSILESSFRAAPLVDFQIVKPEISSPNENKVVQISYLIHSNSPNRLDGNVFIIPPADWRLIGGNQRAFIIPTRRGSTRKLFELEIPANVSGPFPVVFKGDLGGTIVQQTLWLNITKDE